MNPMSEKDFDISSLPQSVQNTISAWSRLSAMAQDRTNYPTLGAEMREAIAYTERDLWKKAAEQLGKRPLQVVEEPEDEAVER